MYANPKVGDKVRIISKSVGVSLQFVEYVEGIVKRISSNRINKVIIHVNGDGPKWGCDYYLPEDLEKIYDHADEIDNVFDDIIMSL